MTQELIYSITNFEKVYNKKYIYDKTPFLHHLLKELQ